MQMPSLNSAQANHKLGPEDKLQFVKPSLAVGLHTPTLWLLVNLGSVRPCSRLTRPNAGGRETVSCPKLRYGQIRRQWPYFRCRATDNRQAHGCATCSNFASEKGLVRVAFRDSRLRRQTLSTALSLSVPSVSSPPDSSAVSHLSFYCPLFLLVSPVFISLRAVVISPHPGRGGLSKPISQ